MTRLVQMVFFGPQINLARYCMKSNTSMEISFEKQEVWWLQLLRPSSLVFFLILSWSLSAVGLLVYVFNCSKWPNWNVSVCCSLFFFIQCSQTLQSPWLKFFHHIFNQLKNTCAEEHNGSHFVLQLKSRVFYFFCFFLGNQSDQQTITAILPCKDIV